MELVALFIRHGDRFTLRNFMTFYIVKIYLESLFGLRAIFGLQPVLNLPETGARLGDCTPWFCRYVLEGYSKEPMPADKESIDFIKEKWQEPFGDMRQELVFIGQGLDQKNHKLLDECLLSDADLLSGKDYWAQFPILFQCGRKQHDS